MRMFAKRINIKKTSKTFKKGVDKRGDIWYYKQAPSRAPNLENDTDKTQK